MANPISKLPRSHFGGVQIETADIAADAITGAKIADDQIDSEHYVDGSIDNAHLAANSVDSDNYVDGSIDAAHLAANSVDSDAYVDGSIDAEHLAAGILDGAPVANVADDNVIGGIPVLHRIDVADGAGDTDVTLTHKTRVVDVWAVKTGSNGGSGDSVQIKNGSNAVTDALDLNVSDTAVVRAGTIDDAQHEIAASGTLRCTTLNNTNNACTVYVLGIRVA